ncbi:hypothetical protein [Thermogymnomonas acidicola]|uniref:hypothetical protein n=1 Tax=Thermogymnomonas acidicola TaxID=399579 RepID=UPI0009461DEC|nr:hypothetical protein [Thermogymnomonas acidicola]
MDASRAATLDDMFMLLNPRDVSLSPSGSRALFSASKTFREKGKQIESGIFVVDVKERKVVRRIWREGHRLFSPCFRSDSAVVYADASDEGMFLVIEDTEKGLAEEVRFRGEIESVLCSGGEVFLIGRPEDVEKKRREKEGDDAYFFEEEEVGGRRLYRYVAGTGFVEVGRGGLNIWEASLSGGEVYAVASDCPHEWCWYSSKLYRLDGDEWRMAYNPGGVAPDSHAGRMAWRGGGIR